MYREDKSKREGPAGRKISPDSRVFSCCQALSERGERQRGAGDSFRTLAGVSSERRARQQGEARSREPSSAMPNNYSITIIPTLH